MQMRDLKNMLSGHWSAMLRPFFAKMRLAWLFIILASGNLYAAGLKKVIILDFKNFDKNPNYAYLESSITDAVKEDLKARFKFKEMPTADWQKLASENYFIWPDENFTRAFGLQMGVFGRQDIVIGGHYQAITTRNKGIKKEVVRAHVFILDIGARKLISEFDMDFPADSTLFSSVTTLANRVADESKSVLPNEKDFQKSGEPDEIGGPNEFSIVGGVNMLSVPDPFGGNFESRTSLFSKDVKNALQLQGGYTRHDFIRPHVQLSLLGGAQFGSGELKVATDTKTIRTSLLGFSLGAHLGYRFDKWRFFLTPYAGGGFYMGNIKLDYSTLSVLPVDSTGAEKSAATLNISSPFVEGGVHLGFQINRILAIQVTGQYRQYAYIGASAGQVFVGAGLSFRM